VHGGIETARDIDAVVNYATALPFARHDGVVVVGQSAGGRGGHLHNQPNNNCRPDLLAEAAGQFGKTATTPMLWVYAANDSFFAPPIARALWRDFTAAGGKANLEQPGPYAKDGHHLFFGPDGSKVWGPLVERYLADQGVAAN
jgi:dienelactone hydrolase